MQFELKDDTDFEEDDNVSTEPSVPLSSFCELQSKVAYLQEQLDAFKIESNANMQVSQSSMKILKNALEKYKIHTEKLSKSNESKMKKLLVYKHLLSEYCKNLELEQMDSDLKSEISKLAELQSESLELKYAEQLEDIKNTHQKEIGVYRQKIQEVMSLLKKEKQKNKKITETAQKAISFAKSQKQEPGSGPKYEELKKKYEILAKEYKILQKTSGKNVNVSLNIEKVKENLADLKAYVKTICAKFPLVLIKIVRESLSKFHYFSSSNTKLQEQYNKLLEEKKILLNIIHKLKGNIRVFCRVRPLISENENSCIEIYQDKIIARNPTMKSSKVWDFDHVFGPERQQKDVFFEVKDLISSSLDGYNVCIFTYGQTGSGKTYTLEGPDEDPGLISQASSEIFYQISSRMTWDYKVKLSLLEVYNETIKDLLSEKNEKLKLINNEPTNLTKVIIKGVEELTSFMKYGLSSRAIGSNSLNLHSSRSHLIMTLYIEGTCSYASVHSKISLIDLAGSERLGKTGSAGETLQEAKYINLSLLTLGTVISAIQQKQSHIPFRNSVLTMLLQDSLIGDARTLMILQISPEEKNYEETVSSLNFAQNARSTSLGLAKANVA